MCHFPREIEEISLPMLGVRNLHELVARGIRFLTVGDKAKIKPRIEYVH